MDRPRITLKEVAKSAGVSYQTVSKVINHQAKVTPETERRIWQAVEDLGYHPSYNARSLRSRRSFTLGYTWPPSTPEQANPIMDQFLQSMFLAAEERGYYLLSFPYHQDRQRLLDAFGSLIDTGRVDGFILSSIEYDDPRVLYLLERRFPFAAFGRSSMNLHFSWIDVDGAAGISQAVQHLIDQGHRRIGALAWSESSRVGANRLDGYFQTLNRAGIAFQPEWIRRGEGRTEYGYQATHELLNLPDGIRPTAVIALNDWMAVGAIRAAQERGLQVGLEFGVVGFDDAPMDQYLSPPLTSIRQPIWEIGQLIIPMLLEYVDTGEPGMIMLPPQLVVRRSTTG